MSEEHIRFSDIGQFRAIIKTVNDSAEYHQAPRPKLHFNGTVKLHGTNASIVYDGANIVPQSRERVLTLESDNLGFAAYVHLHRSELTQLARAATDIAVRASLLSAGDKVVVFGEWCGKGINKGVAINQLEKMFVVFSVQLFNQAGQRTFKFPPSMLRELHSLTDELEAARIFHVHSFQTWDIDIDFANPLAVQNQLVEWTQAVENECPVAKHFGVSGVGEGIVWTCTSPWVIPGTDGDRSIYTGGFQFKVKGAKHSDTKTTNLAPVDIERIAKVKELAESLVTEYRLQKALDVVLAARQATEPDVRLDISPFLKWITSDIVKEDVDTILGNGFEIKEVNTNVSRIARDWFLDKVNGL
jgi:predicted RNase H-related nuclease YkuK (DUF458 family)